MLVFFQVKATRTTISLSKHYANQHPMMHDIVLAQALGFKDVTEQKKTNIWFSHELQCALSDFPKTHIAQYCQTFSKIFVE